MRCLIQAWAAGLAGLLLTGPLGAQPAGKPQAEEAYSKAVAAYMKGKWDELLEDLKPAEKLQGLLPPAHRADLVYLRRSAAEFRPGWWPLCRSRANVTFEVRLWGRPITVNYVPADRLAWSASGSSLDKPLTVTVSWNPDILDESKAAEPGMDKYGINGGHVGEATVWMMLGRSYLVSVLPAKEYLAVATDPKVGTVQEFFALMTSLYHSGPPARRRTLLELSVVKDRDDQRARHAIGALIAYEVLADPNHWPSLPVPTDLPAQDPERALIGEMFGHLIADWGLTEDRALRELVRKFIGSHGQKVFDSRGDIPLPNKLPFRLQGIEDGDYQKKRNAALLEQIQRLNKARSSAPGTAAPGTPAPAPPRAPAKAPTY